MIIDHIRDLEEFKHFFLTHPMHDGIFSFDFIVNNPNLFCAYDEITGELKVYINIYKQDGKIFLSGASVRYNLPDNINFIIKVCDAFDTDIYADTNIKTAKIVLNRAGFKKITNSLYVRYKHGQKEQNT